MHAEFGESVQSLLVDSPSFTDLSREIIKELQSSIRPTILVVEDVHWADAATLDLLKCLCRRIMFLNTTIILSYRSDEVDASHPLSAAIGEFPQTQVQRIELDSLSPSGVSTLAASFGRSGAGVHEATSGNPFFVTELLSADDSVDLVSNSIQSAIRARLARLTSRQREFLEMISVIPHSIQFGLMSELCGEEVMAHLDFVVARQFLVPTLDNDAYRFRHELARLGTLNGVGTGKRRALHKRIYDILDECNPDKN